MVLGNHTTRRFLSLSLSRSSSLLPAIDSVLVRHLVSGNNVHRDGRARAAELQHARDAGSHRGHEEPTAPAEGRPMVALSLSHTFCV